MIAIDLGSNTIRFIEFDGEHWGESFEKIVRTAESLNGTRKIGENALSRIINAINEAKNKLDFSKHDIIAYTTAAMRLASNSDEIMHKIAEQTGILFSIIDSQKEARLTLEAVRYRLGSLQLETYSFVLADIGGGSTELIRCMGAYTESISIDIGIVTLSESAESISDLMQKIDRFKESISKYLAQSKGFQLVLTAGTPTTIAAYLLGMDYESYDPHKINGYRLKLRDCYRVYEDLLSMNEAERIRYVGVGRENLIITGILMVCAIYELMESCEAIIIDDGLREGIALEYYNPS